MPSNFYAPIREGAQKIGKKIRKVLKRRLKEDKADYEARVKKQRRRLTGDITKKSSRRG